MVGSAAWARPRRIHDQDNAQAPRSCGRLVDAGSGPGNRPARVFGTACFTAEEGRGLSPRLNRISHTPMRDGTPEVSMSESVADRSFLQGKQVAFTGRLAAMTQADAADLVRAHGGTYTDSVNRFTAFLIVGQDGWPFESDGRLSTKLRNARSLQRKGYGISVLSEDEFFVRLGLDSPTEGISRLYSTAQLADLLKIPGERIRRWAAAGVIRPVKIMQNISYFDSGHAVSARTMSELVQAGVKPERLRRSIEQMQRWVGRIEQPLLQLSLLEQDGKVLVRLPDGLADTSGQRYFDFDEILDPLEVTLSRQPATAEELFEQGCRHEESGHFNEAVEAYRYALLMGGPNSTTCFNLANVLNAMGNKEQAAERYYQAVELNRGDAD